MPEIKLHVSAPELAALNAQAAAVGMARSQLIRERATAPAPDVARLRMVEYHLLVADAVAFMRGDLPRQRVESLVAYVITRLDQHSRQANTGHQPAA